MPIINLNLVTFVFRYLNQSNTKDSQKSVELQNLLLFFSLKETQGGESISSYLDAANQSKTTPTKLAKIEEAKDKYEMEQFADVDASTVRGDNSQYNLRKRASLRIKSLDYNNLACQVEKVR